ncbi:TetR/AcrR family transcriptional regulator [Kineosporia sp. R_H_3]|uniref:TetR/AcrR family transcriptional regulator n=1 Tax=Kineosporia sp. R_H_3 TaxID=1961848 RepID=UPI000B4AF51F|nr:TetR/AcrR family transcriptional regulator [Kineosporia sp. R_H_3]
MATAGTALSTRERILEAAEDVVLTDGVSCLTLEKAAARAGMSKGGVLYHFRTKDALVEAMVERLTGRFDEGIRAHRELRPEPGEFARAYVEECLAEPVTDDDLRTERVGSALIAAIASQPELLGTLREAFAGWQHEIETDSVDPVAATIARFAADGLWLCELFGIDALSPQMRSAVRTGLLEMVK